MADKKALLKKQKQIFACCKSGIAYECQTDFEKALWNEIERFMSDKLKDDELYQERILALKDEQLEDLLFTMFYQTLFDFRLEYRFEWISKNFVNSLKDMDPPESIFDYCVYQRDNNWYCGDYEFSYFWDCLAQFFNYPENIEKVVKITPNKDEQRTLLNRMNYEVRSQFFPNDVFEEFLEKELGEIQ